MNLLSAIKGINTFLYQHQSFSLYYGIGCDYVVSATALGSLCLLLADGFPGTLYFVDDKIFIFM